MLHHTHTLILFIDVDCVVDQDCVVDVDNVVDIDGVVEIDSTVNVVYHIAKYSVVDESGDVDIHRHVTVYGGIYKN